jgi:hypothetical protein
MHKSETNLTCRKNIDPLRLTLNVAILVPIAGKTKYCILEQITIERVDSSSPMSRGLVFRLTYPNNS